MKTRLPLPARFLLPLLALVAFPMSVCAQGAPERSAVKEGSSSDSIPTVQQFPYEERKDSSILNHGTLIGGGVDTLRMSSSTSPVHCAERILQSVELTVALDRGEEYEQGTAPFAISLNLAVEGVDTSGVITSRNMIMQIDQKGPEQRLKLYREGSTLGTWDDIDFWTVGWSSYAPGGVTSDVRLAIKLREEYRIGAVNKSSPDSPMVQPKAMPGGEASGNPVTLEWENVSPCGDSFPSYQVQLLRLYNTDSSNFDEEEIAATVNWDEALTLETESPEQTLKLTIAEGTGWYIWRVRPIGSLYEGGVADDRNWGVWSTDSQGVVIEEPGGTPPACMFFYHQFDENLNWAYARTFTEGLRVAEGMSYAGTALTPRQQQVRVQSMDSIIVAQTVYDYSGRPALSSVAAPVGVGMQGMFGYVQNALKHDDSLYAARHFDADATLAAPDPVDGGIITTHYDDANPNTQVPSLDKYPYSRAIASRDGSGQAVEAGGPGEVYRIGGGAGGSTRTVRAWRGTPSNAELVNLFGDEAPADTSAVKTMTLDPNGVVYVSYASLDGSVVASGMAHDRRDTMLLDLSSTNTMSLTIDDTLRGVRRTGPHEMTSAKRLALAATTEIQFWYQIDAPTLRDTACDVEYCSTCDYDVRIRIRNAEDPENTIEARIVLPPEECGEGEGPTPHWDTTFTLEVPAGAWIIEKVVRTSTLDTTDAGPYGIGTPWPEEYRAAFAGTVSEEIHGDDSLGQVLTFLNAGEMEEMYDYLGINPETTSSYTIETECAPITFPILAPDCGRDPCRDTIPDFEAYLIRRWGDTLGDGTPDDLNMYFKSGYESPDPVYPTSLSYPNGRGAFNKLIENMLAETDDTGRAVYSCWKLWNIWEGLVQGLKISGFNTEDFSWDTERKYDLLRDFLGQAGRRIIDTAKLPYYEPRGYLLHAYKYLHYELDDSVCNTTVGYLSAWHNNPDSAKRWVMLERCLMGEEQQEETANDPPFDCFGGSLSDIDGCILKLKDSVESRCRLKCASMAGEFAGEVLEAFRDAEVTDYTWEDVQCVVERMIDSCEALCVVPVYWSTNHEDSANHIDSLSSDPMPIMRVYRDKLELTLKGEGECPEETEEWEEQEYELHPLAVAHLNAQLARERTRVGDRGGWWNARAALRNVLPGLAEMMTDSMVWVQDGPVQAHFELRPNGEGDTCALWYVSDTVIIGTPERPHSLVRALNAVLDVLWGMDVTPERDLFSFVGYHHASPQYLWSSNSYPEAVRDVLNAFHAGEHRFINGDLGVISASDLAWISDTLSALDSCPIFSAGGCSALSPADGEHFISPLTLTGNFYLHLCLNPDSLRYRFLAFGITRDGLNQKKDDDTRRPSSLAVYFNYSILAQDKSGYTSGARHTQYDCSHIADGIPIPYDSIYRPNPQPFFFSPFTQKMGRFIEDSAGQMRFIFLYTTPGHQVWNPGSSTWVDDSSTVADTVETPCPIRFWVLPTKPLSSNICSTDVCSAVCVRWVERIDSVDTNGLYREPVLTCHEAAAQRMRNGIEEAIAAVVAEKLRGVERRYDSVCSRVNGTVDLLNMQYAIHEEQFTIAYADRAGNTVRTTPPLGVASMGTDRLNHPVRYLETEYQSNSLGQPVWARTPDGDTVRVWYDSLGRVRYVRDQRQLDSSRYGYIKYDRLGRVVESGESDSGMAGAWLTNIDNMSYPSGGRDRRWILYDTASGVRVEMAGDNRQHNLRNRVSMVREESGARQHYSYDAHGNVEWTALEIPDLPGVQEVHYQYELVSGRVTEIDYNTNGRGDSARNDRFQRRWSYDRDGRMVTAASSFDGEYWDRDARYTYGATGELERRELGEDRLAGLDYTYTAQGGLKGINAPHNMDDPGDDGGAGANQRVGVDGLSIVVNQYPGDFERTGHPLRSGQQASTVVEDVALYDGTITSVTTRTDAPAVQKQGGMTSERYRYDAQKRLISSRMASDAMGTWNTTAEYSSDYTYDANGNLQTLKRNAYDTSFTGGSALAMDSLTYSYVTGPSGGKANRLDQVDDAITGEPYTRDIEGMQAPTNYKYDAAGALRRDEQEDVTIERRGDGSARRSERGSTGTLGWQVSNRSYDGLGRLVAQTDTLAKTATGSGWSRRRTWWVYGAAGELVAIYWNECDYIGPDRDGDSVPDWTDNCPNMSNPGQTDTDMDGFGDACDDCPSKPNLSGTMRDSDSDGVPDDCDNCATVYNPTQADWNSNGMGDDCDPAIPADADGDGVGPYTFSGLPDNCDGTANSKQEDRDRDGIGDACDNCDLFANPDQRDDNNNGIGDECEHCSEWHVEYPLWGVGREGMAYRDTNAVLFENYTIVDTFRRVVNRRRYEVADHLGSPRVVLGDVKAVTGPGQFAWPMIGAVETYPFGMEHPRRSDASTYRYGWQGMEQDTSMAEEGYRTPLRDYDARLGRWLSTDPIEHPWQSPYAAMDNNPVNLTDASGGTTGDDNDGGMSDPLGPEEDDMPEQPDEDDRDEEDHLVEGSGSTAVGASVTWWFDYDQEIGWYGETTITSPTRYYLTEIWNGNSRDGKIRRISWEAGRVEADGTRTQMHAATNERDIDHTRSIPIGPQISDDIATRLQCAKLSPDYFLVGHKLLTETERLQYAARGVPIKVDVDNFFIFYAQLASARTIDGKSYGYPGTDFVYNSEGWLIDREDKIDVEEIGMPWYISGPKGGRQIPLKVPNVSDAKLQRIIVDQVYKAVIKNPIRAVGTGSTADAVRLELYTGMQTGGRWHFTKAQDCINGLQKWLQNNPNASDYDRLVAQSVLDDLISALNGN